MRVWHFIAIYAALFPLVSPAQSAASRRDRQALTILGQALSASGGLSAVAAMRDYTASGRVTFRWDQVIDGEISITERSSDIRIDASLPNGSRSWYILNNYGREKDVDGNINILGANQVASIKSWTFPLFQIGRALSDASVNVSYLGSATRLGHQTFGVRIEVLPLHPLDRGGKTASRDFYFDSKTFLVVATEDFALMSGTGPNVRHQVQFSDYRNVQGLAVPFQIVDAVTDLVDPQVLATIVFDHVSFNAGYPDTQFQP